jgi:hypothetical protein
VGYYTGVAHTSEDHLMSLHRSGPFCAALLYTLISAACACAFDPVSVTPNGPPTVSPNGTISISGTFSVNTFGAQLNVGILVAVPVGGGPAYQSIVTPTNAPAEWKGSVQVPPGNYIVYVIFPFYNPKTQKTEYVTTPVYSVKVDQSTKQPEAPNGTITQNPGSPSLQNPPNPGVAGSLKVDGTATANGNWQPNPNFSISIVLIPVRGGDVAPGADTAPRDKQWDVLIQNVPPGQYYIIITFTVILKNHEGKTIGTQVISLPPATVTR